MKVALIVAENYSAWNFRRGLLKACVESGLDTYLITPSGEYDEYLKGLGVTHIPIPVDRKVNPIKDMMFFCSLYKIFRQKKFDVIHNISIKPNIYGAVAARLARIPNIVGSVTGLGNIYMDEMGLHFRSLRPFVTSLYRFAFNLTHRVWFQNSDDVNFFVSSGMIDKNKVIVIRGSGVNLSEFSKDAVDLKGTKQLKEDLEINDSAVVISMVARALKSKGVEDFIEAAEILSAQFPFIKFILAGDAEDGNPLSISKTYLESKQSKNFKWLGWRHDIREILHVSDIVVLPSRYREGVPKSLLEAMAMNKPIVATNVVGCKEVVEDGRNGYLVPPNNPAALANALADLIRDHKKRMDFGHYSRVLVQDHFDMNKINNKIMEELYLWKN